MAEDSSASLINLHFCCDKRMVNPININPWTCLESTATAQTAGGGIDGIFSHAHTSSLRAWFEYLGNVAGCVHLFMPSYNSSLEHLTKQKSSQTGL